MFLQFYSPAWGVWWPLHFLIGLQNSPRMNLNELKSARALLPLAGWDAVILNFKTVN